MEDQKAERREISASGINSMAGPGRNWELLVVSGGRRITLGFLETHLCNLSSPGISGASLATPALVTLILNFK